MTVPVARYFNSKNVYSIFQQSRKASLLFTTRQVAHSAPVTSKEEKQQSTYLQQSSTTQNIIRKSEWLAAEWRFCFLNEGGAACFFAIVGIVGAVPRLPAVTSAQSSCGSRRPGGGGLSFVKSSWTTDNGGFETSGMLK